MVTTRGKFKFPTPGQFIAEFTIDRVVYEYTATLSSPIEGLSGDVTLNYVAKDQLREALSFVGEFKGNNTFNLRFPASGVSVSYDPSSLESAGEEARWGTYFIVRVSGNGTWNIKPVHARATGTIETTSSTTFVAEFTINDVLRQYIGKFGAPLPEFAVDRAILSFDNDGQIMGSPAFAVEVGISDIRVAFASGVTMSGRLRRTRPSAITGYGTGGWDGSSPEDKIARGTMTSPKSSSSKSTFVASLTVDDVVYKYTASFQVGSPIPDFACDKMALTYQNLGQLIGKVAFGGDIGIDSIKLSFSNKLTMHGGLRNNLDSKIRIFGEGNGLQDPGYGPGLFDQDDYPVATYADTI
ncbi:hypothetical protein BD779DRAFT_1678230 [Infundibulicybe gibba]|nr:hypothetical protein BD779DRAFT_1678230 [Infundibulicybe gibba]